MRIVAVPLLAISLACSCATAEFREPISGAGLLELCSGVNPLPAACVTYIGSPFGLSQAVVDTDSSLVFVSGQVDWNRQYQVSQTSVPGQFEAALENLRTALMAAGASVDSLLQVRLYVRGELEDHMESLAPILAKFLGSSRPAVTGIGVASLASKATLVEVEAVARVD